VAELVISPKRDQSSHYFTLLYNQVDSDLNDHDYESATVSATYLFARNLRGNIEYTRDIEGKFNRLGMGLSVRSNISKACGETSGLMLHASQPVNCLVRLVQPPTECHQN
jgi:hypothetical protein